MPPNS